MQRADCITVLIGQSAVIVIYDLCNITVKNSIKPHLKLINYAKCDTVHVHTLALCEETKSDVNLWSGRY